MSKFWSDVHRHINEQDANCEDDGGEVMITPDMIPDEVVKAASKEYELYIYDAVSADGIRLAIAAALNAWMVSSARRIYPTLGPIRIVFPPPQEENPDDHA
jgi:hypothetical protein